MEISKIGKKLPKDIFASYEMRKEILSSRTGLNCVLSACLKQDNSTLSRFRKFVLQEMSSYLILFEIKLRFKPATGICDFSLMEKQSMIVF